MTQQAQGQSVYQASAKFSEKRRNERHPFTASAEVTELTSNAKVVGRTADLNRD